MRKSLKRWLQNRGTPSKPFTPRITFILGAGVSVALASHITRGKATWSGLLGALLKGTTQRLKDKLSKDELLDRWLKKTSLDHRLHIVNVLSQGDTDMVVAMMYLIDRVHKQLIHEPPAVRFSWQEDLNTAMHAVEESIDAGSDWGKLLKDMGMLAKKGQALIVTTNFDHAVARLAELPVYLETPSSGVVPAEAVESEYCSCPDGCVIPTAQTPALPLLQPKEFNTLIRTHLPAPAAFRQIWDTPSAIPQHWFQELASVLHIHGSRRVPHSLVFDPSSYDAVADGDRGARLLGNLFRKPEQSGAIIFVGCGGTLLDPHFIRYWRESNPSAFIAALADDETADDLCRKLHVFSYNAPPLKLVRYGDGHDKLPDMLRSLMKLL